MDDLCIGIDLGTTNSCVAVYINGKIKILENSEEHRITPSFVYLTSLGAEIVGEVARKMANIKPKWGIYGVKRLIGRNFNSVHVQQILQHLSFDVVTSSNNEPVIVVETDKMTITKTPQELCTIILRKLKRDAETALRKSIAKAVITVPAYFDSRQREATLAAAKEAGFIVLKLFNEPTAAALNFYFENDCLESNYILVYDLGGGTFDVAVLKATLNNIEVLCVDGDAQLGGQDFDNLITDYVSDEILQKFNYDIRSDESNLRRLDKKCEAAKKSLSTLEETVINLIGFVEGNRNVEVTLTRTRFEDLIDELLKKTMAIVEKCVENAKISKSDIKEIILSGGSTRIPKIQGVLSSYFGGKRLNMFVNPDECVAEGAALQAAMLSNNHKQHISKIRMKDVVPLSLGIRTASNQMEFVIRKNTQIPTSHSRTFVTTENQQSVVSFGVFEGERSDVRKNRRLGQMEISDLTPEPPGQCEVVVTMYVDENGILSVEAKEKLRDNVKKLKVNYSRCTRSDEEIRLALEDVRENKEDDERFLKFARLKTHLRSYCAAVIHNLENYGLVDQYEDAFKVCETTSAFTEYMEIDEEEELKTFLDKVVQHCQSIVKTHTFQFMPEALHNNG